VRQNVGSCPADEYDDDDYNNEDDDDHDKNDMYTMENIKRPPIDYK